MAGISQFHRRMTTKPNTVMNKTAKHANFNPRMIQFFFISRVLMIS
jgi:hypothetical protein